MKNNLMTNTNLSFRLAKENDLETIVEFLSDDPLGAKRENFQKPLPEAYTEAFAKIEADDNQELTVACLENKIVACFQLSFLQYITYQGGLRAQIEAVRVAKTHRNLGLGKLIFQYAIERSKSKGAHVVQLTTDKERPEALKFYESLGFTASHEGMKLHLK